MSAAIESGEELLRASEARGKLALAVAAELHHVTEAALVERLPERFTVDQVRAAAEGLRAVDHAAWPVGDRRRAEADARMDATLGDAQAIADGAKPFARFADLYAAFVPDATVGELAAGDFELRFLEAAQVGAARVGDAGRTTEAIGSSTFAEALGASVSRAMIREYSLPELTVWRRFVSRVAPVNGFRTQERVRIGGYGTLPSLVEGEPYAALTSPAEEAATYTLGKKGGTESLNLEAIANDDIGALARIPVNLGRAAGLTVRAFVFGLLVDNATCTYDSTALFHADHANTSTDELDAVGLAAARAAMRQQAQFGVAGDTVEVVPRLLIVPAELEETAFLLTESPVAITANRNATTPNLHREMDLLLAPFLTDDDAWYVVADPELADTIEVGFYRGREEPELFVQDASDVGSMFDRDALTYKIRHIYSAAILDHRGFYRGVPA